jgi:hypothetical protein
VRCGAIRNENAGELPLLGQEVDRALEARLRTRRVPERRMRGDEGVRANAVLSLLPRG